jgi:hypothetical protein
VELMANVTAHRRTRKRRISATCCMMPQLTREQAVS